MPYSWLEPYWKDGSCNELELQKLACRIGPRLGSEAKMVSCFKHLQNHALEKLKSKQLAQTEVGRPDNFGQQLTTPVQVKIVNAVGGAMTLPKSISFASVPPGCSCAQFCRMVYHELFGNEVGTVLPAGAKQELRVQAKLIIKGRTLQPTEPIASANESKTLSLLAIIQQERSQESSASDSRASTAGKKAGTGGKSALGRATALKEAARLMAAKNYFDNLELSYSDGRQVALSIQERVPLVTAIILHSLGKKLLKELDIDTQSSTPGGREETDVEVDSEAPDKAASSVANSEGSHEQRRQIKYAECLTILLEADAEWKKVSGPWKSQVDNYGLLQLDICWTYLCLEHLSSLPDASARIREAEAVLSKQVNPNFLTVALLNAETGNSAVPPLAAIWVRSLLLKAVITIVHENKKEEGRKLLDQANALCKALQVDRGAVLSLCSLGISEETAIVALRKHGGNVQAAGATVLEDFEKQRQIKKERAKQRSFGLTANKHAYVELSAVSQLKDLLEINEDLAVGLLRLANNDIHRAMETWHESGRDAVKIVAQLQELDVNAGGKGSGKRKEPSKGPVDEMSLVSIMSLGVERELAETALRSCDQTSGSLVDAAMDWLISQQSSSAKSEPGEPPGSASADDPMNSGASIEEQVGVDDGVVAMEEDGSDGSDEEDAAKGEAAFLLIEKEVGEALRKSDLGEQHLGLPLLHEKDQIEKYLHGSAA